MKASTLTIERNTDLYFLARMEEAETDERDAVFADLAARALAGDELATRTIRLAVLPVCRRIAAGRGGDELVATLVDAAYEEILEWAILEGHATR